MPCPHTEPPDRAEAWRHRAALLLMPALLIARQDNILFAPRGSLDTWLYLGYFRHLVEFKRDFPYLYYGSRLGWLLPGAAVHAVLPPEAASIALHLGVWLAAVFALFSLLSDVAGVRPAFLTCVIFTANPFWWVAAGTDYVDGAGIAWGLIGMALLTRAALAAVARPGLLAAAGAALAAAVYTNLFLATLLPLPLIAYGSRRKIRPLAVWASLGALLVTALCGAVNYTIDGRFWFYEPSWRAARELSNETRRYFVSMWASGLPISHLWVHAAALGAALATLPRMIRARDPRMVFSLMLIAAAAYMGTMQATGRPVLGLVNYAGYLLPFSFAVIGVVFWRGATALPARHWFAMCAVVMLSSASFWWDPHGYWLPSQGDLYTGLWVGLAAATLAASLVLRWRATAVFLAACGFLLLESVTHVTGNQKEHSAREALARVVTAGESIETARQGLPILFWFDRQDAAFFDYQAISSTYLLTFNLLGDQMPRDACAKPIPPHALLVAGWSRPAAWAGAWSALRACKSLTGVRLAAVQTLSFDQAPQPYHLTLVRASPDPDARLPLGLVRDAAGKDVLQPAPPGTELSLDRWKIWDPKVPSDIRRVPGGLAVRSPKPRHAFAVKIPPFTVPRAGRYEFTMAFSDAVGNFAFGACWPTAEWFAVDLAGYRIPGGREMRVVADLTPDKPFVLAIENSALDDHHPASLIIRSVKAALLRY